MVQKAFASTCSTSSILRLEYYLKVLQDAQSSSCASVASHYLPDHQGGSYRPRQQGIFRGVLGGSSPSASVASRYLLARQGGSYAQDNHAFRWVMYVNGFKIPMGSHENGVTNTFTINRLFIEQFYKVSIAVWKVSANPAASVAMRCPSLTYASPTFF